MSQIATEIYLAYSLDSVPDEALNPTNHHTIIVKQEPRVLACVDGFFMMAHPKNEKDCPYDRLTDEEVMQSVIMIPTQSFQKSLLDPNRYLRWSPNLAERSDGLTIDRFIEHIITHETLHLILQELGEHDANHKFDQLSREKIAAKIGHSPYYTLGVHGR